jgi:hypothetical protein
MNFLHGAAGALFKTFIGDVWLAIGILSVVSLTALLTKSGVMPPLFGGAILFLGCIVGLVASVVHADRRRSSTENRHDV